MKKSTTNTNPIYSYFSFKKPEATQQMENLEDLIKMPLQDRPIEDLVPDINEFCNTCTSARDYLNKLRHDTRDPKDLQGKGDLQQPSPFCMQLLKIVKVFLEESLHKILMEWERTLNAEVSNFSGAESTKILIQITSVGLEMLHSVITMLCVAVGKKQKILEEMNQFVTQFRNLSEIATKKPALMLLGEYQLMISDPEHVVDSGRIIHTLERTYKEVWKLIFLLKKLNQLGEQADALVNILEIALVKFIDSKEVAQNMLGFEIAMTIFMLTDNEYYQSLINVLSTWNKSQPMNNIGKLYQIIFLYANETVRERILAEVEALEPKEMLNFLQLFDTKMYEGFLEGGLLFQEQGYIVHQPSVLGEKLKLSPNVILRLQNIMNIKVCEDLKKTAEILKNQIGGDMGKERRRFIELLKIASISVTNPIFLVDNSLIDIHQLLLQIIDEYLSNPADNETHYVQIQIIIDLFHGLFKELNATTFGQILDLTKKSNNPQCQMFAAKFGNIVNGLNYEGVTPQTILDRMAEIYHNMLLSEDFIMKFKAVEGIMLTANNSNLPQEDLATIVPPRDEDKELLRKIADPSSEAGKKVEEHLNQEMIGIMGGRLSAVKDDCDQSIEKFKKIEKSYPYDIGPGGDEKDEQMERAFVMFEESIQEYKEANLNPKREFRKLQIRNRLGNIINLLQN